MICSFPAAGPVLVSLMKNYKPTVPTEPRPSPKGQKAIDVVEQPDEKSQPATEKEVNGKWELAHCTRIRGLKRPLFSHKDGNVFPENVTVF